MSEALLDPVGHREAVEDHADALGPLGQHPKRVVVGGPGVDHERLTGITRELDLGVEGALLIAARGVVAVIVEARLPDRDALLVRRERMQLGQVGVVEAGRLVRVAPDGRVHLRERVGGRERGATGPPRRADGDDPRDAGRLGGRDELGVGRLADVEMRVAVDHALLGNSGSSAVTRPPGPRSANLARS